MPNSKTAKKRVLVNRTKTLRNKSFRSDLRTAVKKADTAIEGSAEDKVQATRIAMQKIDRAVSKGILHKNTAARKKSRLAVRLNRAG